MNGFGQREKNIVSNKQTIAPNIFISGAILIIFFILLRTLSQVFLKFVALGSGGSNYLALAFDPLFYLCGLLFVGQAAVWLAVLRRFPLSQAYPFTSLVVITMMISGAVFFDESIKLGNILGAMVIMTGVKVIASGYDDNTRKIDHS